MQRKYIDGIYDKTVKDKITVKEICKKKGWLLLFPIQELVPVVSR